MKPDNTQADTMLTDFRRGIRLLIEADSSLTRKAVAETAGLHEDYMRRFLSAGGQGLNPTIDTLSALAGTFDMQIEDVVRYARACDLVRLQLIAGGQEDVIKHLLYFRKELK